MMAVKLLTGRHFEKPYFNSSEDVAYVRRLSNLIQACEANRLDKISRILSLQCVVLGRNLHNAQLARQGEYFDPKKNFKLCGCAKHVANVVWLDFSVYSGVSHHFQRRSNLCRVI